MHESSPVRFQYKSKFKSPCLTPVFQRPVPVTPARQRHKPIRPPFGGDQEGAPACVVRTQQPTYTSATLHDTVLKRYRVAAGSARTIHDYLRPPRLPSLPRFFHPSRLFSLRDPSYTHDSAIEIATGIAPHDSAMEIATGIARGRPLSRPTQSNSRAAPNSTHRH